LNQLFLCGVELRTIKLHHMVTLVHRDAGVVHIESFQAAGYPGGDVSQLGLIIFHLA
jgi:hypothetical protein